MAQALFGDNSMVDKQMERMVQDEPNAEFMDLFLAHQSAIYAFLRSLIPYHADAEEIFQQVALTLWRKRESFDPKLGSFRAWAMGVTRNHIRNFARQQARDRRLHIFAPEVLDRISEGWQELDDMWADRQTALSKCIKKLNATGRRQLEHYYGGDVGPQEMADAEGVSLRTMYRKIQRLRKLLLECISKTIEAEGGAHG